MSLKPPPTDQVTLSRGPHEQSVEQAVQAHLRARGEQSVWAENSLFSTLFGLAFWDLVFADQEGAFAHGWQRAPLDMEEPRFSHSRRRLVARTLDDIRSHGVRDRIATNWARHYGTVCTGVHWHLPWSVVDATVARLPRRATSSLLEYMLQNPARRLRGWPDLAVFDHHRVRFVEVKGPGDQLRDEQRDRLSILNENAVDARVLRVRWETE